MITLTNYTILTFYYLLVWAACAAPLSEKIMIELLFEEERNHVFKLRLTILKYEYLFVNLFAKGNINSLKASKSKNEYQLFPIISN